jgi:hypothetical protein
MDDLKVMFDGGWLGSCDTMLSHDSDLNFISRASHDFAVHLITVRVSGVCLLTTKSFYRMTVVIKIAATVACVLILS